MREDKVCKVKTYFENGRGINEVLFIKKLELISLMELHLARSFDNSQPIFGIII